MAKNTKILGQREIELVSPLKILVKPGTSGGDDSGMTSSSLRRRSLTGTETFSTQAEFEQPERGGESGVFFVSDQVNRPGKGKNRNEGERINDDTVYEKKNVAYYLQHCFRLMYFTGMSTYNPDKKDDRENTWKEWIINGLQKVAFWTIALVSFVFSLLSLKIHWIAFRADGGVLIFVYLGNWLFTIVAEVYFIYLLAFRHKRIKDKVTILEKIDTYNIDEVGTKNWKCKNPQKMITVLFLVSIFACFMHPMSGEGIQGWSPEKLILASSKKLSIKLFIWSPDDISKNLTKLHQISQDYGTKLTPLTFIMGITEISMRFSSNLKMDTIQNLGVVVAVLTWLRNRYFGRKVKNIDIENYTNGYDTDELDSPTGLFAEFKHVMRKENRMMNGLVGGLLKIIHAYNLMQCASFLMRCLDNRATLTEMAFLLYGLTKVSVIYYFGKKAETENEVYEQWIRDWAMYSRDPIFLGRVPAILDEMTKEPLGVGRGKFLVGHGFIFRFLGFVSSIFMLEVDDDDSDE